jgi:hypothetical protein
MKLHGNSENSPPTPECGTKRKSLINLIPIDPCVIFKIVNSISKGIVRLVENIAYKEHCSEATYALCNVSTRGTSFNCTFSPVVTIFITENKIS